MSEQNENFAAHISEAYGRHSGKYAPILEPILRPMAEEIVGLAGLRVGEKVLDLATGTGLIARTATQSMAAVVGIDISTGILARARNLSRGMIPFISGDAHNLPVGYQCFDLVTCGLSLSHFADQSAALEEIRRVLRPKGRFITSAWSSEGENPSKDAAVEVRKKFLDLRQNEYNLSKLRGYNYE